MRGWPVAVALVLSLGLALAVFTQIDLRTDMADFLPAGETPAARLMVRELRSGWVSTLILIGIDQAEPENLARISQAMTKDLQATGLFMSVSNGARGVSDADEKFLFAKRYLLSPTTTADAFSAPALRQAMEGLRHGLETSAAPLVTRFGLADPPGAFLTLVRGWLGNGQIRLRDGVWFAPDRDRALLVAQTRRTGMDLAAQNQVADAIAAAFAAADPGGARLIETGPAVFAHAAALEMRGDVRRLTILSSLGVAVFLFWRFRSPWVIAAIFVPVVISLAVTALAVQLAFGFVHGVALGFGMTMLGVTVDYPVLLIGHRKRGEAAGGTLARIGPTLLLAVIAAALGLTGMIFSGFSGLAQLGVFAVTGVLAAAAATRLVLPRLIVAADLAPVYAGDAASLLRVEQLRRGSGWTAVPVAAAVVFLAIGGPVLEDDMTRLSPVPAPALIQDRELRAEIGAPDAGQLIVLRGQSAEAVLIRQEALLPALDGLVAAGAMTGFDAASRFLPSSNVQRTRQAALPPAEVLAASVRAAQAGLGFRADAFDGFLRDVEASRHLAPVVLADLGATPLGARLRPLLFERDDAWFGLIAPTGLTDAARLRAAIPDSADSVFLDMKVETNTMVARYTGRAGRWLGIGAATAALAVLAGLRSFSRAARVTGAVACACLVTVALLAAAGTRFSLIHIVSLQLVAGIGLDYALFFARRQLDDEERARTLRTLVTCNGTTLLTFGLLALCSTRLLRDIGITVVIGALSAMVFSFLLAGPAPERA